MHLSALLAKDPSLEPEVGDVRAWGSHAFRTGAARDIVASSGPQAAVHAGQWASLASLAAYASHDGITSRLLTEVITNDSDDDSQPQ